MIFHNLILLISCEDIKKNKNEENYLKKNLSRLNLLPLIEQVNFLREKRKNRRSNHLFKKKNPTVKLSPGFYLYETFTLNYEKFYTEGRPTAKWLIEHIECFKEFKNLSVLDWGCGTGRIVRHFPSFLDKTNFFMVQITMINT